MVENWQSGGFGLYVHWPFCEAKCPYCDFNSHIVRRIEQSRWAKALASEVRRVSELTEGRVLQSIFFGGGTPSLMEPDTVEAVLRAASDGWTWANDIEITLEANPSSVEAGRFQAYRDAGVNRVSLGIQSLRDDDLRRLGRLHSVAEAKSALNIAQNTFDRVSFDLIYARQDQSLNSWETELREALNLAGGHISLYQLTIEQGTAFGDRYNLGKLRGLPEEDDAADMFELTQEVCRTEGLEAYEVSNHARPGQESKHNLIYWRYGDYVGVGPGAHGRITRNGKKLATTAYRQPGAWLNAVETGLPAEEQSEIRRQEQCIEHLMMGLRLSEGLDLAGLHKKYDWQPRPALLTDLQDLGLIWKNETRFGVTQSGRQVLNSVLLELLPDP